MTIFPIRAAAYIGLAAVVASTGLPHRATGATSPNFGHLYLAQGADIAGRVYRYPLRADGLPSKTADGVLNLHVRYPGGIAIGPEGNLYVSSSGDANACKDESKCFVEVFAPGASGDAAPIRILYVPAQPQYVAVDERGYLVVSVLAGGGHVYVYEPGARGNDVPIGDFKSGANALAATRGIALVQTNDAVIGVPEHSNGRALTFVYPAGKGPSSNGVAADGTRVFAAYDSIGPRGGLLYLGVGEYRLDRPGAPIREIVGTGCHVSLNGGALGYGLAVHRGYLFEQCIAAGGAAGVVFVYDAAHGGKQAPLLELPGGNGGVAIGP